MVYSFEDHALRRFSCKGEQHKQSDSLSMGVDTKGLKI